MGTGTDFRRRSKVPRAQLSLSIQSSRCHFLPSQVAWDMPSQVEAATPKKSATRQIALLTSANEIINGWKWSRSHVEGKTVYYLSLEME